MGYSHYWTIENDIPDADFRHLQIVSLLLVNAAARFGIRAEINLGTVEQKLHLAIDGDGKDAYETFYLTPRSTSLDFCKTARKPYDDIVVAVLQYAESEGLLRWRSDGGSDDHEGGIELLHNVEEAMQGVQNE